MEEVVNTLEVSDYISIGACLISVIAAIASIYNGHKHSRMV